MGFSDEESNSAVRFSFGRRTGRNEIEEAVPAIAEIVAHLRRLALREQHTHA